MTDLIILTEKAAKQIKTLEEYPKKALRIKIEGGGCSGLSYKLEFDDPTPKDRSSLQYDVRIIVDPKTAIFIHGTVLDFTDGLNGKGFEFHNPNAKRNCGCGSSFSV